MTTESVAMNTTTTLSREMLINANSMEPSEELFRFTNIHEEIITDKALHWSNRKFNIWLFGTNQIGESIGIRVDYYQPWFYINLLPEWEQEIQYTDEHKINAEENEHVVNDMIRPALANMLAHFSHVNQLKYPLKMDRIFGDIELVTKIPMIGFNNFQRHSLAKVYFKDMSKYCYNRHKVYSWFTSYPLFNPLSPQDVNYGVKIRPYHINQNNEHDYNLLDKFFRDNQLCFQTWYKLNYSVLETIPGESRIHVKRAMSINVCDLDRLRLLNAEELNDNLPSKTLKLFLRITPISQQGALQGKPFAPNHQNRFDVITSIACTYQWSDQSDRKGEITSLKTIFEDVSGDEVSADHFTTFESEADLLRNFAQEFNDCDPDCIFIYDDVLFTIQYLFQRLKLYNISLNFERIAKSAQRSLNLNQIRSRDYINMCKMLAKKVKADIYDIRFMASQSELIPKDRLIRVEELKFYDQYAHCGSCLVSRGQQGRTTIVKGTLFELELMKTMENHVALLQECQATSKCQCCIASEASNRGEQYRVLRLMLNWVNQQDYYINRYQVLEKIQRYSMREIKESYPIDEESSFRKSKVKNGFNNQGRYRPIFGQSKANKESENRGGYVHNPIPGYYPEEEISGVLDFKSLYPSIMICYTFSPDTILWNRINLSKLRRRPDDMYNHEDFPGVVLQACRITQRELIFVAFDKRALLRKILSTLLSERKVYKGLMKQFPKGSPKYVMYDMAQLTTKVTCNATYGFFNVSNEKGNAEGGLIVRELALITTAVGRSRICLTRSYLRDKYDVLVIYGDTDSVFIYYPHPPSTFYHDNKHEEIMKWHAAKFNRPNWTWESVRQKWFLLSKNNVDINNIHPFYQRNAVFMFVCHQLADELNEVVYTKGLVMEFENMCSLIHFVNRKKWYTYNSWSLSDPRKIDYVKTQGQEGKKRDYCLWIRNILNFINECLCKHRIVDKSTDMTLGNEAVQYLTKQLDRMANYECSLIEMQKSFECKKKDQYKKDDAEAMVVMNFLEKHIGYTPIPGTRAFSIIRQPFRYGESVTERTVPTIAMTSDPNVRYDRLEYLNKLKNPLSTLMLNFPSVARTMKNIIIRYEQNIIQSRNIKRRISRDTCSSAKRIRTR